MRRGRKCTRTGEDLVKTEPIVNFILPVFQMLADRIDRLRCILPGAEPKGTVQEVSFKDRFQYQQQCGLNFRSRTVGIPKVRIRPSGSGTKVSQEAEDRSGVQIKLFAGVSRMMSPGANQSCKR